jgi:two-component system, NarL family, response regulator LiaR
MHAEEYYSQVRLRGRVMNKIRIVLAEDHHVVRAAVAALLANEPDIEIAGDLADATTLIGVVATLKPDVLILDAHMPGATVIDLMRTMRVQHPEVRVLVLSAYDRSEYVVGLLRAGASGYILKDDPAMVLVQAVHAVARGERWLSPRVTEVLVRAVDETADRSSFSLTEREHAVLRLMVNGSRNDQIAAALSITEQTVKNHVRNIFRKLGVETRVEAVVYAIRQGLITDEA